MAKFSITHTDQYGEKFQLEGVWEAETPQDAIAQMLGEANAEDADSWEAHQDC